MLEETSSTTRRRFLTATATAGAIGLAVHASAEALDLTGDQPAGGGGRPSDPTSIRPFRVNFPEAALADLRRRVAATRWPDRETVADDSQGVQLATMQALARYWATDYDWRKCEARLNALPQFVTEIDGLDIHFIHVRSKHANALPLIITHGWPGSIIEQMKVIEPLTNPTAHGGTEADAFHVVIPSLPGHGFSAKPTAVGWGPERTAHAWVTLMHRVGYPKFVAQGGDWGSMVTDLLGAQSPESVLAIHNNMPATVPNEITAIVLAGGPAPAGLSADEAAAFGQLKDFFGKHVSYAYEMTNRPQTLYGISDSPIGLASWMLDHDKASYEMIAPAFDGHPGGITRDDALDNITLYWLTNTGISSARLYWENKLGFFAPKNVVVPVAVSVFPDELYQAPRSWAQQAYPKLIHYNRLSKGGHFAAWEQPVLFVQEVRDGFRSIRTA
jgi:pimeloyl-ACP methyl ester carboxylesterase